MENFFIAGVYFLLLAKSRNNLLQFFPKRWLWMSDKNSIETSCLSVKLRANRSIKCARLLQDIHKYLWFQQHQKYNTPQIVAKNKFYQSITWLQTTIVPKFNFYFNDYQFSIRFGDNWHFFLSNILRKTDVCETKLIVCTLGFSGYSLSKNSPTWLIFISREK